MALANDIISSSEGEISSNLQESKAAPRKSAADLELAENNQASALKIAQHAEASNIIHDSEANQAYNIAYTRHAKSSDALASKMHSGNSAEASSIIHESESMMPHKIVYSHRPKGAGKALAEQLHADNHAMADEIVRSYQSLTTRNGTGFASVPRPPQSWTGLLCTGPKRVS